MRSITHHSLIPGGDDENLARGNFDVRTDARSLSISFSNSSLELRIGYFDLKFRYEEIDFKMKSRGRMAFE